MRKPIATIIMGMALIATVAGCTPLSAALGVGAAAGVAAYQERGIGGVARDLGISSRVLGSFARRDNTLVTNIGITVYEGRVLLTGQVKSASLRAKAVRLAWQVDGVKDVINEIHVTAEEGLLDTARDVLISTNLTAQITFDKQIMAINYSIKVMGGTVYLMGIAQNARELGRVKDHARNIAYVKRIVSYVRLKKNPPHKTHRANG